MKIFVFAKVENLFEKSSTTIHLIIIYLPINYERKNPFIFYTVDGGFMWKRKIVEVCCQKFLASKT